jgi:hypothetical protein
MGLLLGTRHFCRSGVMRSLAGITGPISHPSERQEGVYPEQVHEVYGRSELLVRVWKSHDGVFQVQGTNVLRHYDAGHVSEAEVAREPLGVLIKV